MHKTKQSIKPVFQQETFTAVTTALSIGVNSQKQKTLTQILHTLQYIHQSYANKISLDELANLASMSRYHYSRAFKKVIGLSPIQYLSLYRINRASQLLITTNWSITRIAQEVGFNQSSSFAVQFKKMFTLTPSHYRQAMCRLVHNITVEAQ